MVRRGRGARLDIRRSRPVCVIGKRGLLGIFGGIRLRIGIVGGCRFVARADRRDQ